jgi:hypothetical protein
VPATPQININQIGNLASIDAKAITTNGNKIADAIVKNSRPVLTVVPNDTIKGFLTSIQSLP